MMQKSPMPDIAMNEIPAGVITMRDDRTSRTWSVNIAPFLIGSVPVTRTLYQAVTGGNPIEDVDALIPVVDVSWLQAVQFCNRLSSAKGLQPVYKLEAGDKSAEAIPGRDGFRLPSEAEWEFACRAASNAPRYGELDDIAWYQENSNGHPHEVAQKQANDWGLFDMLGNVWEWCADQYDPEVYGAYRVFRGGGWADQQRGCLASNRRRSHPDFQIDDLGFRLARSIV